MSDEIEPSEVQSESDDEPELAEPEEWWSWGNFARLFIFPLVIVVVAVGLYGTFQYLLQDNRSVEDYVADIKSGPENHRWRAAYDLAQHVQYRGGKDFTRDTVGELVKIFRTSKNENIRTYLAHVLAKIPSEQSIQALEEGLRAESASVRESSALALGKLEATGSISKILPLLEDESYEVRRMSAFALGALGTGSDRVEQALTEALNDGSTDVRLNAAIALTQFGSSRGESVLLDYLDRALAGELEKMNPRRRQTNLSAVMEALSRIKSEKALPLLKRLQEQASDSTIRRKALEARRDIEDELSGGT